MKQFVHWIRQQWMDLTQPVSTINNPNCLLDNESDDALQNSSERPLDKVYYGIPGRGTYWAYIDKGRIISAKTTFVKGKFKWPPQ